MSSIFIFNQYYIDFLKRIKTKCKEMKETNEVAKKISKIIKEKYAVFDKSSEEYINYVNNEISEDIWNDFLEKNNWVENNKDLKLYYDIRIEDISNIVDDEYLFFHFITIFYIFRTKLSDEESTHIVKILQSSNGKEEIESLTNEKLKIAINKLFTFRNENIKDKAGMDMKFIENTTIGKLAKEIMKDIDVDKLQKSIGENGDVLKAIGDPDSGFAEIITNVSQKMASKISNGELKQENIIQDAMKFASAMPGLFGEDNKSNKSNTPDISEMMKMMSSMMGGGGKGGMENLFKNFNKMNGGNSKKSHTKAYMNENAIKKNALAKKLKKKLRDKKKEETHNNVNNSQDEQETHVINEIPSE